MDNPNMPIIAVNLATGEWAKVLDSQLPQALENLGEGTKTFRVSKDATVVKTKGQLAIRGISFPIR